MQMKRAGRGFLPPLSLRVCNKAGLHCLIVRHEAISRLDLFCLFSSFMIWGRQLQPPALDSQWSNAHGASRGGPTFAPHRHSPFFFKRTFLGRAFVWDPGTGSIMDNRDASHSQAIYRIDLTSLLLSSPCSCLVFLFVVPD